MPGGGKRLGQVDPAERPADDEALQAAHGRIERLHNEAAARAQAFLDGARRI